jgi:hypothetical protein
VYLTFSASVFRLSFPPQTDPSRLNFQCYAALQVFEDKSWHPESKKPRQGGGGGQADGGSSSSRVSRPLKGRAKAAADKAAAAEKAAAAAAAAAAEAALNTPLVFSAEGPRPGDEGSDGLYCLCQKPYNEKDFMIMCVVGLLQLSPLPLTVPPPSYPQVR